MDDRQLIADLLSALEYHTEQTRPIEFSKVAIEAAREYLRKPEQPAQQEPVAPKCGAIIEVFGKDWRLEYMSLPVGKHKLYTQQYTYISSPAQRTWVSLTDEEIINVMPDDDTPMSLGEAFSKFAEFIEAKLKEKNNG